MTVGTKAIRLQEIRIRRREADVTAPESWSRELLCLAGILALTLFTYASTFTFGWVYDDTSQIVNNPDLRWSKAWYLLTHHLWAFMPDVEARFYRPLLEFWFLINKSVFGLNPHWFHVTTVAAHLAATGLAYAVARMVLRSRSAALLAAGIFGVHPMQAEVASWISSVNDSLMAVFCFSSFIAARKARTSSRWGLWVLSGVLFLAAVLIKESSALLPLIVGVDLYLEKTRHNGDGLRQSFAAAALAYIPVGLVWLFIRKAVLGSAVHNFNFVPWTMELLSVPKVFLIYLCRALVPAGLSPHYDCKLVGSFLSLQFAGPALALALVFGAAMLAVRYRRDLLIAYAWAVVPLLPAVNLRWMNQGDFLHDRYTYMAMLGIGLCLGAAFEYAHERYRGAAGLRLIPFMLVPAMAFASAIQSQFWANDMYLFSRAVRIAPKNEWAHLNHGNALMWRGRYAEAAQEALRSYELRPGWRSAQSAAFAYFENGDLAQSKRWYVTALQINSRLAPAWFTLGQIRMREHSPVDALAFFQNALQLQPEEEGYHYAMGAALEGLSRSAEALQAYQSELRLHPSYIPARQAVERLSAKAGSEK